MRPHWLLERLDIQKQEVKHFLWEHYFSVQAEPLKAITDRLSIVLSYQMAAKVPLGMSARKWVDLFTDIEELDFVKKKTVDCLTTLQNADPKKKRSTKEQVFRDWVALKMPEKCPAGKLLTRDERRELANFWAQAKESIFSRMSSNGDRRQVE